eukprot:TRINITY_DN68050_c6_g2_i1.p1 TRINITY_DN68050_c6_g2~~TRINITY_DN68050_c6_g2_i1.p1  ORF type:complete len:118 (+),score=0.71 TRINITY_DN68050_c6_g2_i1:66-419(+)
MQSECDCTGNVTGTTSHANSHAVAIMQVCEFMAWQCHLAAALPEGSLFMKLTVLLLMMIMTADEEIIRKEGRRELLSVTGSTCGQLRFNVVGTGVLWGVVVMLTAAGTHPCDGMSCY